MLNDTVRHGNSQWNGIFGEEWLKCPVCRHILNIAHNVGPYLGWIHVEAMVSPIGRLLLWKPSLFLVQTEVQVTARAWSGRRVECGEGVMSRRRIRYYLFRKHDSPTHLLVKYFTPVLFEDGWSSFNESRITHLPISSKSDLCSLRRLFLRGNENCSWLSPFFSSNTTLPRTLLHDTPHIRDTFSCNCFSASIFVDEYTLKMICRPWLRISIRPPNFKPPGPLFFISD